MKTLTKDAIKAYGKERGLDLVGVANIERLENAPVEMNPRAIFPECRSVIAVGRRIVRGGWRGIEEGTHWPSYTYFDYHGLLNTMFIPLPMYELMCLIEDAGYEAVPYYPGGPEVLSPDSRPTRPGQARPDVNLSIRLVAVAAGLGEMGWSKVFMSKEFGPRQRLAAILTDMPLEADPLVEPGSICDRCMLCVKGCLCGAIPHLREKKTVRVQIEDKVYEWGDVHMGKCTLSYHGGDPMMSPFMSKALPGFTFDVREQDVSEEVAYKFAWTMSTGGWRKTIEHPEGRLIPGHSFLQTTGVGGSYGIEGSRGCMRSCFDHIERKKGIGQEFANGKFIRRERWQLSTSGEPLDAEPLTEEVGRGRAAGMPVHTQTEETRKKVESRK